MLFKNSPSDRQRASSNHRRRLGIQLFFLLVIAAAMFTFLWKQKDENPGQTPGGAVEDIFGGGPFDVKGPWGDGETEDMIADLDTDDPFGGDDESTGGADDSGDPGSKVPLEPWKPDDFMLVSAASRDRTPDVEEKGVIHESAVGYFAHRVAWESRDGASETTEQPVLSTIRKDRVWQELYRNPDKYRGKLIEIQASVVRAARDESPIKLRALPEDVPAGTDRAYRAYVVDGQDVFHHYLVYTLDDQRGEIQHLDGVLLRGYFCRLYRGEISHNGKRNERSIPVLVGARYEKISGTPSGSLSIAYYFPIAVVLLSIAGLTIFILTRRSESSYEARRKAGRKNFAGADVSDQLESERSSSKDSGGVVED